MWQLPPLTPEEILLYSRKSRTDDPLKSVEEVLAKHEQMLDEWVKRNFPDMGPIPEENRYREVVSGETLDSRPKIQKVLRLAESSRYKAILVVEPQRLSRGDLEDIGRLVKILRYSNTLVLTLPYNYDLRDERDRDQFERELKRGNEFLEYQKKILNNGRLLSVQNGNYLGKVPPYGYKKIVVMEGKQKCHTLEPDPERAPYVKMMFELYRDGLGWDRITDRLNAIGAPPPTGKKWYKATLSHLLKNEHYIGKVVWSRRKNKKQIIDGELVISRPYAEEYLVFEGKQPAIIDMDLWNAVQEKRGKIPRNTKAHNLTNPLAGIAYCKKCGRALNRREFNYKDGRQKSAPRFLCPNARNCGQGSASVQEVIDEVISELRSAIADFEIQIERGQDNSAEINQRTIKNLKKRELELREEEIAQWDEKIKGLIPQHVFERLNQTTLDELEKVRQRICDAEQSVTEQIDIKEKRATYQEAIDALLDPDATVKRQNELLKRCLVKMVFDRKRKTGHPSRATPEPLDIKFTRVV